MADRLAAMLCSATSGEVLRSAKKKGYRRATAGQPVRPAAAGSDWNQHSDLKQSLGTRPDRLPLIGPEPRQQARRKDHAFLIVRDEFRPAIP